MEKLISILHVEDDARDADLVYSLLSEEGIPCTIHRVSSRAEFEEALRANRFDLILCDYNLPSFDGLTALRISKTLQKEVPLIFVSGTIGEDRAIDALREGATDYILKDRIKKLGLTVRRVMTEMEERKTRKELEQQLIQAQKMESIGTLAGGVAHDFNNILGIIMGYASLLGRAKEDQQIIDTSVDAIMNATNRGAALVRQLLTIARKVEIEVKLVDLNEQVEQLVKLLRQTFPKSIEIKTELATNLPQIMVDQTQLHQVLLNLCVNARDAMPKGGRLLLKTRSALRNKIPAKFTNAVHDEYIVTEVSDSGDGMSDDIRHRIFEPFFTTKNEGTGLGLAVSFGIVQKHDGFMDVNSKIGNGTTFAVYFPVKR